MTRPAFSAEIIADLTRRVIAHNDQHPQGKTRLQDLKKLYQRHHHGQNPGERALRKVDEHLADLAKAFDPSKHPRRSDGRFGGDADPGPADETAADKAKRLVGGIADAAAAGGAGVKRGLHHAAYQAGLADEPLAEGVAPPDEVPLDLPADRDQHRALQDANAGYSAFTSDVIPERRAEIAGALARTAIAAGGGVLVGHILTSKKANSRAQRVVAQMGALPTGMAAKLAVGVPLHSLAAAARLAEDTTGMKLRSAGLKDFAHDASAAADAKGRMAGRAVINGMIRPMRYSAARLLDVAEGKARMPPDIRDAIKPGETLNRKNAFAASKAGWQIAKASLRAKAGRAGATVFLAALPAYLIDKAIEGSPLDPQQAGAVYDQTSYRVVRKALAMPETEALRKVITGELRKADILENLGGDLAAHFANRALRDAALASVGSVAGSAVGAAAGAGTQAVREALNKPEGNPYHDKDGRFTSKAGAESESSIGQAALAGAAAGALIGGGAQALRLRALNRTLFRTALDHLDQHVAGLTDAAMAPGAKSTVESIRQAYDAKMLDLEALKRSQPQLIADEIAKDPKFKAVKEDITTFGAASPLYYKERARAEINAKLTSILAPLDKFQVPLADGALRPMTDIRTRYSNPAGHVNKAIDGMSEGDFEKAIKNLSPAQQETARKFFKLREASPDAIDAALVAHRGKIGAAAEDIAAKRTALTAAEAEHADSKAVLDRDPETGSPEREAAEKAYAATKKKVETADKAYLKAKEKHAQLKNNGPEIVAHLGAEPILPPAPNELRGVVQNAEIDARSRAEAAVSKATKKKADEHDKLIKAARDKYLADLRVEHARKVGTFVALGRKAVGLGDVSGKGADGLLKAHADHAAALGASETAETRLAAERGLLAKATKKPDRDRLKASVMAAQREADEAGSKLQSAQTELLRHSDAFSEKYNKFRLQSANSSLPALMSPELRAQISADVSRAVKAGYDPISRYAVQPTAAGLKAVTDYLGPRASAIGSHLSRQADRSVKGMFMRQYTATDADGRETKYWAPDAFKIGASAAGIGALAEFIHKTGDYAHSHLFGDKKAKAPTNLQVEIRRHPTKANEGLFAVHAADPRNKNERIVVFGHRYEEGRLDPIDLNPGARLSDVINHAQNRDNNRPGGGNGPRVANQDASWLSEKTKGDVNAALGKLPADKKTSIAGAGVTVPARHPSDSDGNDAAGKFMNEFRAAHVKPETSKNTGAMYGALNALFQKQSEILKPSQFYQMLTGYRGNEKKGDGVLGANEDWGSNDTAEVQGALDSEITRIMDKASPRDDAQRDALRRAVAVIGKVKNIPADQLQPIYDKIAGGTREEAQPIARQENAQRREPQAKPETVYRTAPVEVAPWEDSSAEPRDYSAPYADQAERVADVLAPRLGIARKTTQGEMLQEAATVYIRAVAKKTGFDIPTSAKIVMDAFDHLGGNGSSTKPEDAKAVQAAFRKALAGQDSQAFERAIAQAERRHRHQTRAAENLDKNYVLTGFDLDDLGALTKRMPSEPGLASTGAAQSDAVDGGAGASSTKAPNYKPLQDSLAAAADLTGAGVANHLLNHALPKVAPWAATPEIGLKQVYSAAKSPVQSLKAAGGAVSGAVSGGAGNAVRAAGSGLKTLGLLGAKGLIAGGAGAALYSGVQNLTGGQSYRRNASAGENLGMGLANFGGALAGESAGKAAVKAAGTKLAGRAIGADVGGVAGSLLGPVGTVAGEIGGGAIGGALAEYLSHSAIKAFQGYEPGAVRRVLGTSVSKPAPGQEQAATAGEVGGGVVGNALAGGPGEGLGGAVGSALGILKTKVHSATQRADAALSGRPNNQQSASA